MHRRTLVVGICLAVCVMVSISFLGWRGVISLAQGGDTRPTYVIQEYVSYQFNVLKNPTGLTVLPYNYDTQQGLAIFIADTGNHVIRRFDTASAQFQIVAGTGQAGYVNGNLAPSYYVPLGQPGPPYAQFDAPSGVTGTSTACYDNVNNVGYDCFDLVVSDTLNHVLRRVQLNTAPNCQLTDYPCQVTTLAGNGSDGLVDGPPSSASFSDPTGITMSTNGWYVADAGSDTVRAVDWFGNVSTYAGNGTSGYVNGYRTSAQFTASSKITKDAAGNMYVADIGNNMIRKIDTAGNVATCAGAGPSGHVDAQGAGACFFRPTAVVYNSADNMLYVADSHNNCIRRIDMSGNVTTYAGTGTAGLVDGARAQAQFSTPTDLVIVNGFMYVSDSTNNAIRRIDMASGIVSTYIT